MTSPPVIAKRLRTAALVVLASACAAAAPVAANEPPAIFDEVRYTYRFEADGTARTVFEVRAQPHTAAGVQQLGQIVVPYLEGRSSADLLHLRVLRPDGATLEFDPAKVQDLPAPVAAAFPVYSDLRLLHAPAPALNPGDTLEYGVAVSIDYPDTPGHFSVVHVFGGLTPVENEILEIDVPAAVEIKLRTREGLEPTVSEADGRRLYRWEQAAESADGTEREGPDVELSSFRSWDEVGSWYLDLSRGRATPDKRTRRLAQEITGEAMSDRDRLRAIHEHVTGNYRYLGLSLGLARYQPQSAGEVIANGYGDCKDKHTLLEALLAAVGIEAHPVLISSVSEVSETIPALHSFDHMITLVTLEDGWVWLDATNQVTPFGFLDPLLRGKQALVIGLDGASRLERTPDELPFESTEEVTVDGKITPDGDLTAELAYRLRGDSEVILRGLFFSSNEAGRQLIAQELVRRTVSNQFEVEEVSTSPLTATAEPFELKLTVRRPEYLSLLRDAQELDHYLIRHLLPEADDDEASLELGSPRVVRSSFRVELPAGFEAQAPAGSSMATEFGSYVSEYSATDGVLSAERTIRLLKPEISPVDYRAYRAWRSTLRSDDNQHFRVRQTSGARASRASEGSVQELFDAGLEARKRGDYDEAVALLSQVVDRESEHPKAWLQLGRALTNAERFDEAVSALERQIEIDPYAKNAYGRLGWALEEANDRAGAEAAYRRQIELYPLEPYAPARLGRLLEKENRCAEGIPYLETALSLDSDRTRSKTALGVCLLAIEKMEKARAILLELLEESKSGWELNRVGHRAFKADELELAESLLERATQVDPGHEDAFNNLGLVLLAQKRIDDAVTAFRRQVEIEPEHKYAHNNLGRALRRQGETALAVASFRRQIAVSREDPWAHRNLGLALKDLGDVEGAIDAWQRHLELDPLDLDTLRDLVQLGAAAQEALAIHLRQVGEDIDDAATRRELKSIEALLLVRSMQCDRAVPLLEALAEDSAASYEELGALTFCHYTLSNTDPGLTVGKRALTFAPDDPQLHAVLGMLYAQKGDYESARDHLETAAAATTGLFELQDLLDYVRSQSQD